MTLYLQAGNWTEDDELKLRDYPETDMWYTMAKGYSKVMKAVPILGGILF